ncbi:hypothetical protein EGYY_05720 [Eggerthella sp. YY7918]|nr:hypothetical protein EGYY_05720 [Eggerthella sp. YY7918]
MIGRSHELTDFRSLYVLGPTLAAVGTLATFVCAHVTGLFYYIALVVASLGTGLGPVVIILLWTCLFARTETGIVETIIPASFVVTLACALIIPNLQGEVAIAVIALLPLASGALLLLSERAVDQGSVPTEELSSTSTGSKVKGINIARMFLLIFAVYGIGCLLPVALVMPIPPATDMGTTLVGMILAVILSAAIVLFSRRIDLEALFRWISVPFVFAIICAPLHNLGAAVTSRILLHVVFTGIEIIMVLYFIRLAQKTSRTSTFFVSLGECAAYTGLFLGYMLQGHVDGLVTQSISPEAFCLFLVGAFTALTLLVPRYDVTLAAPMSEVLTQNMTATMKASAHETNPAETIAEHRTKIARSYGLSKRETEIFLLLAQGRSRPYIRDTLVLSKNTVATHIRHIYEKLDIHSQQELIDLAEED